MLACASVVPPLHLFAYLLPVLGVVDRRRTWSQRCSNGYLVEELLFRLSRAHQTNITPPPRHPTPPTHSDEPPFDRHDWVIRRPSATSSSATSPSTTEEVRYVIDYYSAPDDPETDEPVFNLDVRPALDSVGSARVRFGKSLEEVREWWSQGQAQQAGQAQAQAQGQKA